MAEGKHRRPCRWTAYDFLSYPEVGLAVWMVIAPVVILSASYRKEINQGAALERVKMWAVVIIGCVLWIALISLTVLMIVRLFQL